MAQEREVEQICEAMLQARDALLAPLVERRRAIEEQHADPPVLLARLVDHALETERHVDRLFWLSAAGDLVRHTPTSDHAPGRRARAGP